MGDVVSIANILITIMGLLIGFSYRTIMARIDKLEQNTWKDNEDIKIIIKEVEGRNMHEISSRVSNITDLHGKVEHNTERAQDKYENLLIKVGKLEGKIEK